MTTASAYTDSDNCIACHIEKINEKLKATINHSLIPGKATGNLIEPGICKSATADLIGSLNMRFFAISKPVKTPINDDLIYGTNTVDEWNKFLTTYKPFPFYSMNVPDPKNKTQDTFIPTVPDSAAKAAVMYSTPDTTLGQISAGIQQQITATANHVAQAATVYDASIKTDSDSSFLQSIQKELDQMNYYFDSFQNILASINSTSSDNPGACQTLATKNDCS